MKRPPKLFTILCLLGAFAVAGAPQPARGLEEAPTPLFNHLGTEDGLSHPAVQALLQDSAGFIWIGTQQGLNRYDGHRVEVFKHHADDPRSISNGWIYAIAEDHNGVIWVGTDGGLNRFDPIARNFTSYRHIPGDRTSLLDNSVKAVFTAADGSLWVGTRKGLSRFDGMGAFEHFISTGPTASKDALPEIRAITQGGDGLLWVGTQNRGLAVLDPQTGLAREFEYRADQPDSTSDRYIRSLLIDDSGTVWVGTRNAGISRVNPADGSIERLTSDGANGSLSSNRIWKIYQDPSGQVWVATEGGGINQWLPEQQAFRHFRNDPTRSHSLADDVVYDVIRDAGDVIWLGTFAGISKYNATIEPFSHIHQEESNVHSLSNNKVSSFLELDDGDILVGTIGGGLNLWDTRANRFSAWRQQRDNPHSLSDDMVMSLMLDREQQVWVGTMQGGINLMQGKSGQFIQLRHSPDDPETISSDAISRILQDSQGRIWIATFGGGLNRYLGDGRFRRYPGPDSSDSAKDFPTLFLVDIAESPQGHLWLASDGGGLLRFDPVTEQVEVFQHDAGVSNSPSGNHLVSLLQAGDTLWVGTRDTGLNAFRDGEWQHFSEAQGLPGNAIYGILEDDEGRLWLSHSAGLSVFNPHTRRFINYSRAHGLQGDNFNNGAHLRTRAGTMLFGGSNGFNLFDPAAVHENRNIPPLRLTRFTKFNQDVALPQPAWESQSIQLGYDDYVIGFEFAALDYTDPRRNQYRYRLRGFDPDWVVTPGVQQATYTNLAPGHYVFEVQGSNNDGIWNPQGMAVDIYMPPPPWASWWAYLLYCAGIALLLLGAGRVYRASVQRREQQRQNERLESLVAERTRELQDKIGEKEVLLKEVHHRVKNNMQVISSLLSIQAASVPDPQLGQLLAESQQRIKSMALIHENLYRSDNLLEINFREYIEMLAGGLLRSWRGSTQPVQLDLDVEAIYLDLDCAVPCGLIINELISNSLEHAFAADGVVDPTLRISFRSEGEHYHLVVADNGPGLPADIDIATAPSMGLEIVRILTRQIRGELALGAGPGAVFQIRFPRLAGSYSDQAEL